MSLNDNVSILDIANKTSEIATNLDDNFIPIGTVIHVELDGSGDFTSLHEVAEWLHCKYSNGQITIQLGAGTFNESSTLAFNSYLFNIPLIIISGQGKNNTTINFSSGDCAFYHQGTVYTLMNLTVTGGKVYAEQCQVNVTTVNILSANHGIYCGWGSYVSISDVYIENMKTGGIVAENLAKAVLSGTISMKNIYGNGFTVARASRIISIAAYSWSGTISTKCNINVNTWNGSSGIFQTDRGL